MRLLPARDHRVMPWKNGAGSTTQVAVFPPDAGLDDFLWRVSMADVVADGPFSRFEGIDRTLAILEGEGVELAIQGMGEHRVTREGAPLSFPADVAVASRLIGGPVRDLNVMSRRGIVAHRLSRLAIATPLEIVPSGHATLILSRSAGLGIACEGGEAVLGPGDAVLIAAPARLTPAGTAEFHRVELFPA